MRNIKRLILVGAVLSVSIIALAFARSGNDSEDVQLTAPVTAANGSGISGTA